MDEPELAPVTAPSPPFSCHGPMLLPGLVALLTIHVGMLFGFVVWVRAFGLSWMSVGVTLGGLASFWLTFLLIARWLGGSGVINLLGLASVLLFWPGVVIAVVWWLAV